MEWFLTPIGWLFAWRPRWRDAIGRLLLRIGKRFFVLLALGFALAGGWDQFLHPFTSTLSNASFDWLMRHRPIAYPADPGIVVLDIDEASLAALSADYGRWPWPRQVLAQVAGALEAHQVQAVVFDILFADPDVANPQSEAVFDRYVSSSRRSFYPVLRLNPDDDRFSQVTLAMLNFAQRDPQAPLAGVQAQRTIAVLPPYFKSIYDSTRMGTHNVYPDFDNVVRWYQNYETLAGYRIPSLPYRAAQLLGWPLPRHPRDLLNWPRGDTPYRTISFVDALHAASRGDAAFFRALAGKVVLIGSTAPSLNDIKATPVDRLHPGIYVLATAIDNTRNARFLNPLGPVAVWLIELLLLGGATALFTSTEQAQLASRYFVVIPTMLLLISLVSVSLSDQLVDLSVPTALFLSYFAIASLFTSHYREYVSGTGLFAPTAAELASGRLQLACLPNSFTQAQLLTLLGRAPEHIKLWRPAEVGLGAHWAAQGWVVWRLAHGSRAEDRVTTVGELTLRWVDVPQSGEPDGSFSLARIIAGAAAATTAPVSSSA